MIVKLPPGASQEVSDDETVEVRYRIVAENALRAVDIALSLLDGCKVWRLTCEYDFGEGPAKVYNLDIRYADKVA